MFQTYHILLVVMGIAVLAAALLPRLLWKLPLSMPIALLLLGYLAFALPLGLPRPDLSRQGTLVERLTEIVVIVSLMGAGLKIDRPFHLASWGGTWRLLGITMILSIGLGALSGWWIAGFAPAAALLFGSLIAPTDPVLASEIQVGAPQRGSENAEIRKRRKPNTEEDEFRFTLTSEAGLNDGLAFPFVHAAIAIAAAGTASHGWAGHWLLVDVIYKLAAGVFLGVVMGRLLGRLIFSIPGTTEVAKAMVGPAALAVTLIIYGSTECLGGYGFVATFVGALSIRSSHREHEYHEHLHTFAEMAERLLVAGVLVGFGGAIAGGILAPLTLPLVVVALLAIFAVRPLAGMLGLGGFRSASLGEKWAIAFFGVRGVGSFYYLAYALNRQHFSQSRELWAVVSLVVITSVVVHGIFAAPVSRHLDRNRVRRRTG